MKFYRTVDETKPTAFSDHQSFSLMTMMAASESRHGFTLYSNLYCYCRQQQAYYVLRG